MPWVNLSRLLAHLRQRQMNPREIAVFVDDHVVDPRSQRPLPGDSIPEETEELYEDDSEVDEGTGSI